MLHSVPVPNTSLLSSCAAFNPPAAVLGHSLVASASNLNIGVVTPAASIYQTIDPRLGQSTLLAQPTFPTVNGDFLWFLHVTFSVS